MAGRGRYDDQIEQGEAHASADRPERLIGVMRAGVIFETATDVTPKYDTPIEAAYCRADGIMPYVLEQLLAHQPETARTI